MNKKEKEFVQTIYGFYTAQGRDDLPWRKTNDPYKIAVSEVMLQQTKVARVIEKYHEFLLAFPDVYTLAQAPLVDVLKVWSGLGYNRRARFLKSMAGIIVKDMSGVFPKNVEALERLPGVGHYTARAIAAFAYGQSHTFIETNIRTVYLYHFFRDAVLVDDKILLPIIERTVDVDRPREWYWALMDYGSHLKSLKVVTHRQSMQYKKQDVFIGSVREVRGAIIKLLTSGALTTTALRKKVAFDDRRFILATGQLAKEGLIEKVANRYQITR